GEYAQNIRRAVDWLMARSRADGRIGNPNDRAESEQYMDEHGHALQFLASVYGDEEEADRRQKLQRILTRAIEFAVSAQTSGGGWGHVYRGLAEESDNQAEVGATIVQIQSMGAARSAGIVAPKKSLDAALAYLKERIDPSSPAGITGLAGAFGPGEFADSAAKQWLRSARKFAPVLDPKGKRRADDELNVYYFALVAYSLGEEGHGRLLPSTRMRRRLQGF